MTDEAMIILTAKSADTILAARGTQSWVLDRGHAKQCGYAVLCQNAHSDWGDGKEPHGKGFMVGRLDDVVPSTETEGRWLITFSEYAVIDRPGMWGGWRNPVRYTSLGELGIDPGMLKFKPTPTVAHETPSMAVGSKHAKGMTIAEAKQALAQTFGVAPDAVEITIRG